MSKTDKNEYKDDDKIILRLLTYIADELDVQERAEVKRWIESNEEHRLLFEKVRRGEMRLRWGVRVALIRGRYVHVVRRISRQVFVRWGRVAAAVALLLGAGGVGYRLYFSPEPSPVVAEFITPGQPRAMLYLASGEVVPVGDSPLTILDPNVTEVNVKEGGELTYAARKEAPTLPGATHRISIPRGGEFSAVLGDGTKVRLNSRTELSYPVHFSQESREVYLEGEAYFEVVKDGRPFVVHVGGLDVRVLGTEFNVNTQTAGTVKTVLVTGSVEIASGGETVRLSPNQLATYRDGKFSVRRVDVTPHVAWKDNNFVFDKERLEDIMETLSLWYDMEVIYESDLVKEMRLTGDLERYEDVRKLLYFFEKTSSGLHFDIIGKTVIVR
ncbi:MAG: FecR domain-containing protein [Odoribacteraceae bacterium]|jgi:ferric-dicitrate binding protein FerR (iron transport regulator)|nr:FecR domain-containing protein [Odoribacteraceae bacterium]